MSANPMHVLRYLGLDAEVSALGVRPGGYVFRLHDTGEIIQQFALSAEHERQHGAPYVQLHRADLHELLASTARKLKPDVIQLDRRATRFTETDAGVTLHFADGSSAQGDILVGADGLKSTVARQIVGEIPATYTGDAAWRHHRTGRTAAEAVFAAGYVAVHGAGRPRRLLLPARRRPAEFRRLRRD